ncbi:Uncharacterized protein TCM_007168 [Theobroma cacao]|uniref:Uncharacterized protein n=1 Tax=Theobroma cacao TaxID=3641 RepID=A0A061E091_THECC|nr:Uncharacterized protein TCM_007168 [Theobroma cacao]
MAWRSEQLHCFEICGSSAVSLINARGADVHFSSFLLNDYQPKLVQAMLFPFYFLFFKTHTLGRTRKQNDYWEVEI